MDSQQNIKSPENKLRRSSTASSTNHTAGLGEVHTSRSSPHGHTASPTTHMINTSDTPQHSLYGELCFVSGVHKAALHREIYATRGSCRCRITGKRASSDPLKLTAVSVVLPWSTCPMVPMLTCGLLRSKVESPAEGPGNRGSAAPTRAARRTLLRLKDSAHFERAQAEARLEARRSAMLGAGRGSDKR